MSTRFLYAAVVLGLALTSENNALKQTDAETARSKTPVVFTTRQDHQNMLDQMGITRLRPGRSSNEDSPNAANYDESKANPYPVLPEILKTKSGAQVSTPAFLRMSPASNGRFARAARSRRAARQQSK